jgi:hypothetical protein
MIYALTEQYDRYSVLFRCPNQTTAHHKLLKILLKRSVGRDTAAQRRRDPRRATSLSVTAIERSEPTIESRALLAVRATHRGHLTRSATADTSMLSDVYRTLPVATTSCRHDPWGSTIEGPPALVVGQPVSLRSEVQNLYKFYTL